MLPGGWSVFSTAESRSAARRRACRASLISHSAECHGGCGAAVVTMIGLSPPRETESDEAAHLT